MVKALESFFLNFLIFTNENQPEKNYLTRTLSINR